MRPRLNAWLLALVVMALSAAPAAAASSQASAADPSVVRGVLPNGLRYAILRNRTPRQEVSIRMQVDAGAGLETASERGAAHLIEHLAYDGSRRFPGQSASERFAAAGVGAGRDQNAFTDADGVLYVFDIPQSTPEKLALAFDWLRDVGDGLTLDPAQVEREKGVVTQEIAVRRTGSTAVSEAIARFTAPGVRAAGLAPGGTAQTVAALDAAGLRAFHDRWYRPERTRLVVVGDVDPAEMRRRIAATFGGWRAVPPAPAAVDRGAVATGRPLSVLAVNTPNFSSGLVQLCRVSPRDASLPPGPEAVMRAALDTLWIDALDGRLRRRGLAPDAPYLTASAVHTTSFRLADYTCLTATPKAGRWSDTVQALAEEARRLDRHGLTEAEAARGRAEISVIAHAAAGQADTRDSRALAAELLATEIEGQPLGAPAAVARLFDDAAPRITAAAAADAFRRRWNVAGGPAIVVLSTTPVTPAEVQAAWRAAQAAPEPAPPVDEAVTAWPYAAFGPPGAVVRRETVADFGFTRVAFANGVRLNVKRTPYSRDRVDVRISFGAGQGELGGARTTAALAGAAVLTQGGLGRLDAEGVGRALQGRIWNASLAIGRTQFTLAGWTRAEDLRTELQLLAAYLSDAGFRPEAARTLPTLGETYAKSNRIEPLRAAEVAMNAAMKTPHVFDPPAADAFARLTAADLAAALRPPLTQAALEVTIVGDVDEPEAVAAVAATLGALPPRPTAERRPPDAPVARFPDGPRRIVTTHEGLKDKAAAYLVWPLFVWTPERQREARALTLLREVLGDQVREEVRERLGITYTPSVGLSLDRGGDQGSLTVAVSTSPAETDRVAQAVAAVAARLAAPGGVTPAMLEKVRRPLLEETARRKETNAWWLGVLDGSWGYPYKLEQQRTWEHDYATIPASEVSRAAARWLASPPFVVTATPAPEAPPAAPAALPPPTPALDPAPGARP